jgi:hypothetical protein
VRVRLLHDLTLEGAPAPAGADNSHIQWTEVLCTFQVGGRGSAVAVNTTITITGASRRLPPLIEAFLEDDRSLLVAQMLVEGQRQRASNVGVQADEHRVVGARPRLDRVH